MDGNSGSTKAERGPRTRSKRVHWKNAAVKKTGKGRRKIFKMKPPVKSPTVSPTFVTCEYLFYKGSYFTIGDIVSVVDYKNRVYYAQIRGLMQDKYCEKSAVLTWLLPTKFSPRDHFDPATYIAGLQEEFPRKMECLSFVCHAPSDYYKPINSPYPTKSFQPEKGFIWTRLIPSNTAPLPYPKEEKARPKANPISSRLLSLIEAASALRKAELEKAAQVDQASRQGSAEDSAQQTSSASCCKPTSSTV